jgi:hypothetical protein
MQLMKYVIHLHNGYDNPFNKISVILRRNIDQTIGIADCTNNQQIAADFSTSIMRR